MYRDVECDEKAELIELASQLLSDPGDLYCAMDGVVRKWRISAEVNMTNRGENRRAWLGQAACCFIHDVPEDLTREAWNTLSIDVRVKANTVATHVIKEWESQNLEYMEKRDQLCLKFR